MRRSLPLFRDCYMGKGPGNTEKGVLREVERERDSATQKNPERRENPEGEGG